MRLLLIVVMLLSGCATLRNSACMISDGPSAITRL